MVRNIECEAENLLEIAIYTCFLYTLMRRIRAIYLSFRDLNPKQLCCTAHTLLTWFHTYTNRLLNLCAKQFCASRQAHEFIEPI